MMILKMTNFLSNLFFDEMAIKPINKGVGSPKKKNEMS